MHVKRGTAGEKVLKAAGLRFSAAGDKGNRFIVADLNRAEVEEGFAREAVPAVMAVAGVGDEHSRCRSLERARIKSLPFSINTSPWRAGGRPSLQGRLEARRGLARRGGGLTLSNEPHGTTTWPFLS